MYFVDFIPGNKSEYLLFDLKNQNVNLVKDKNEINSKLIYCFDLYRYRDFFGKDFNFVYDLQSLHELQKIEKIESLEDLFDEKQCDNFFKIKDQIDCHYRTYKQCKIQTNEICLSKLIPSYLFNKFFLEKLKCISNLINSNNIHQNVVDFYCKRFNEIKEILNLKDNYLATTYDIFGAKNARLSIKKDCINLYNLPKEKRIQIKAPKDYVLCQIDYKSFQPRIALALFGGNKIKDKLENQDDIYSLFPGDREENKIELISWMFSNQRNERFDNSLSELRKIRESMLNLSKNNSLKNIFGRMIFAKQGDTSNIIFQNYICSTESDCIMALIKDTREQLKQSKSYLLAPFYDSLIFCIHNEDIGKIKSLKEYMETYLHQFFKLNFPVSVKIGLDLYNMKEEK